MFSKHTRSMNQCAVFFLLSFTNWISFHMLFVCLLFLSLSFSLLSNIKTNIWVFPFVENTEQLHKKNPISNKWQQYANSVQMKRPEMNASKQSSERAKTYVCDIDPKKHLLIVISLTPIGQCIVNSITGFNLRNTRTFGRHTHTHAWVGRHHSNQFNEWLDECG